MSDYRNFDVDKPSPFRKLLGHRALRREAAWHINEQTYEKFGDPLDEEFCDSCLNKATNFSWSSQFCDSCA